MLQQPLTFSFFVFYCVLPAAFLLCNRARLTELNGFVPRGLRRVLQTLARGARRAGLWRWMESCLMESLILLIYINYKLIYLNLGTPPLMLFTGGAFVSTRRAKRERRKSLAFQNSKREGPQVLLQSPGHPALALRLVLLEARSPGGTAQRSPP
jgi:hypothetical protein